MNVGLNEQSQSAWQQEHKEHIRYEYDLKESDVVIDLGAYTGEWSSQMFARYGCKLILVDPGPWIRGFPIGRVINKAAADFDGLLNFGGDYYYTSAHEEITHQYLCFDVNKLLKEFDEVALLKINIEGSEYKLLQHIIDNGLQSIIKNLQVQFHTISNKPYQDWYNAIADSLSETHTLSWRYPFCWENWTRND